MEKKIKLLIVLILIFNVNIFCQTYKKQNTYLDALKLADIINSKPHSIIVKSIFPKTYKYIGNLYNDGYFR